MPPTPKAIRVKTSDGWQDIAIVGPPGPVGPVGPAGPAGAGTPVVASCIISNPTNVSHSVPASWGVLNLNPAAYVKTIEPAGAFTVNADGSVTVLNAGWYHVSASAGSIVTGTSPLDIYYLCVSTSSTSQDGDIANGQATAQYPRTSCAGDVYLAAGQKIWCHQVGAGTAIGANGRLFRFSIHRIGAGPAGPVGGASIDPELFKVDRKLGTGPGGSGTFTSANPYEISGAVAGDLRFSITPARNCWWEVTYRNILQCLDAAWYRLDGKIMLDLGVQKTDAAGWANGQNHIFDQHNAQVWQAFELSALFKLEAGKSYTARCVLFPQQGTWQVYNENTYCLQDAKVVGFW